MPPSTGKPPAASGSAPGRDISKQLGSATTQTGHGAADAVSTVTGGLQEGIKPTPEVSSLINLSGAAIKQTVINLTDTVATIVGSLGSR